MLYLWLADSVGVYGAVHVDCGAVLLSQNGLPDSILNAADIRMLTVSMPECQVWSIAACTSTSNKLTVHVTVNVLPGSNWSCCQAPAQSWANIQTCGHRSVCVRARTHTHTHTHIVTHTLGSGLVLAAITFLGRPHMSWELMLILAEPRQTGWWLRLVMSAIWWWYVLLTWSITGVACRACHSSGTFFHCVTHMCVRAKTHARSWWRLASAGHKRVRLVLIVWQNLIGHGDDVWRACVDCCACCWFGTVASLWLACLRLDYLACLATWKLDFFFWQNLVGRGGDLHLVMSVIWRSCAWKYRLSCFKCHLPGTFFSLCFTCSMHTHPFSETCHSSCDWFFFWKCAEVWTIET